MSDKALDFLRTLNSALPDVSLSTALFILSAAEKVSVNTFDLTTPAGLLAFARGNVEVMQGVADQRKITAIKSLRAAAEAAGTRVGLKEAKDALDSIMGVRQY